MRRNEVEVDQTEFRLSGVGLLISFDSILVVRTGYGKELSGENAFPGAYVRKSDDVEEALAARCYHRFSRRPNNPPTGGPIASASRRHPGGGLRRIPESEPKTETP